jgi:hypothetical protein
MVVALIPIPASLQTLTDLDDFLAPSQACILPVRQTNKVNNQEDGSNANVSIYIVVTQQFLLSFPSACGKD